MDNGNYKIINNKSNLLLSVRDGSLSNEAYIVQERDMNDLSQQWIIDIESSEEVRFNGLPSMAYNVTIKNAKSKKTIDLRRASFSDGAPFIQFDYHGEENQKFLLVKHIGKPVEQ